MTSLFDDMYALIETVEGIEQDVVLEVAEIYKKLCESHTHVDTGRLIGSYEIELTEDGAKVSNPTPYAIYCEYLHQHYMFHKALEDLLSMDAFSQVVNSLILFHENSYQGTTGTALLWKDGGWEWKL